MSSTDAVSGALRKSSVAALISVSIVLQIISAASVFARMYSRARILHSMKFDDYLLFIAWILGTALSADIYAQLIYGSIPVDYTNLNYNPPSLIIVGFLVYLELILFIPLMMCAKVSMCLSYRRILYAETRSKWTLDIVAGLIIVESIALEFYSIFLCDPISLFWTDVWTWDPRCHNVSYSFFTNGSINLATDVVLMGLMVPQIMNLKIHGRQRVALFCVFSLGWLVVAAGIARIIRVEHVLIGDNVLGWDIFELSLWTVMEVHITLFCASAPYTKPLVSRFVPKLLGTNRSQFEPTKLLAVSNHARTKHSPASLNHSLNNWPSSLRLDDTYKPDAETQNVQWKDPF